ncbi:Gnt-II system L-idonate transporter [Novipirellula galeiformis]|uniref:Gnt-II system L-idonate transporter n=1 Tax=Novipirellula galeiformis TaxID=2528004 RepID=A0A5C6CT80_9BACT|nr:SLC13 family permease [Novipirellula galeiformis]TWU26814.1 Gnt-II system L-idonate transporter [Novipirellula galeiformis]
MTRPLRFPPLLLLIALALCFVSNGLFSHAAIAQAVPIAEEVANAESIPSSADLSTATGLDPTPVIVLAVGIFSVLGMIIGLKLNAFLALILSALIVSLLVGINGEGSAGARMDAVVSAFGSSAGSIGIVIAMAAIIGKCMLDSGAADRIVRSAVHVTGEKKASLGLMVSGFVLAVPVFFDTVFYLLVPLARSLHRRTNKNYLRYLMAIATGGAITHTLVPPTPGPLLVSSILGVDIGMMMLVGTLVAIPAAIVGLIFSIVVDNKTPVVMRPLSANENKHKPLLDDQLPSLWIALLPVLLPVVLIGAGTLATTVADREDRALLSITDIQNFDALANELSNAAPNSPAGRILASGTLNETEAERLTQPAMSDAAKIEVVELLNEVLLDADIYSEEAFLGVALSDVAKTHINANQLRMKPVDRRRMNRALLEDAFPELIKKHEWDTPKRQFASSLTLWSNPNFALMLAAICAMLTLKIVRTLSWRELAADVEESLMSGGVIILITAAGGAFGSMLTATNISDTIQQAFENQGGAGMALIVLGWSIAAVLKIAQGSSTVAMIIGAGMMSAIIGDAKPEYNMVYIATAVGAGSLMGSWMNDSGFWVFTKMGGLTEGESLRSWTPLLAVLSLTGLVATLLLSQVLPLRASL